MTVRYWLSDSDGKFKAWTSDVKLKNRAKIPIGWIWRIAPSDFDPKKNTLRYVSNATEVFVCEGMPRTITESVEEDAPTYALQSDLDTFRAEYNQFIEADNIRELNERISNLTQLASHGGSLFELEQRLNTVENVVATLTNTVP